MKRAKKKGIYDYLYSIKVLESGTDEDISLARKKYWREYKASWRRKKRKEEKELTTSWTADEITELTNAAKKHKVSKTKFIKTSTLAYINKRYIVPDQIEVRRIAQLLAVTYNSIREMMDEDTLELQTGKIILEKINRLYNILRIRVKYLLLIQQVNKCVGIHLHYFLKETRTDHPQKYVVVI